MVHSFRALSTLRRSGLRTASIATKPYQGDSSEGYLITGRVKPTTSASRSKPSGNTNNALVKHSVRNAMFGSMYAICNKCLFDANHDMCLVDFVNDVNVCLIYKSKRNKKIKAWKPTGKVFTYVGFKWKPTGRFFTIVGNSCPLARTTSKKIVHLKGTTHKLVETPKPDIKVYSRRPKQIKSVGSSKKIKIVESKIANNSESTHLWGSNSIDVPSSSSLVNDRFSRSSSGVDLLSGSRDTNLYTISLDDTLKIFSIYFLSKASKTKSWLWHRLLSHLNFSTLNKLAKDGLARGIPKLKFQKDHLCSTCALGKSKKYSHLPTAKDTNQEKLYLLHMDLCGLMRVESINEKKYIIVYDYSRFTWVKFLRSKDEAHDAIIKSIKNIQVCLNATVRNVRLDNRTEFVNQTLRDFYENVSMSRQTFVARTTQQNDVVERQNQTLVEAARTMLIFSKAPLFLWGVNVFLTQLFLKCYWI
nr:ribonuclease H-like domain-containing protein [Tanacetum cinerariifolium]GEZ18130.1 ribonuclease H-like domain-containing protein [Tanacetum cinerariifolium]